MLKKNEMKKIIFIVLCILSLGLVYILHVYRGFLLSYYYDPVDNIDQADYILITFVNNHIIIQEIERKKASLIIGEAQKDLIMIELQGRLYILNDEKNLFIDARTFYQQEVLSNTDKLKERKNGLDSKEVKEMKELYGKNAMIIKGKTFWQYLMQDLTKPVTLIEFCEVAIFYVNGNIIYASILFLLVVGINIHEAEERVHAEHEQKKLHDKRPDLQVIRKENGIEKQMEIDYKDVVPGDVILIQEGVLYIMDMLLIEGQILVDESKIKGIQLPVLKKAYIEGTKVKEENLIGSESVCEQIYNNPKALVLTTGNNSLRGKYFLEVNYQNRKQFSYYQDFYVLLGYMLIILSVVITLMVWQLYGHKTNYQIFKKALELVIVFLNPTLLISLTFGFQYAQNHLKKIGVHTKTAEQINMVGQVKYMCFDKTGTLTKVSNDVAGFLSSVHFLGKNPEFKIQTKEMFQKDNLLIEFLSSCNELKLDNNKIVGMDVDKALFQSSKCTISEQNNLIRMPDKKYFFLTQQSKDTKFQILKSKPFNFEKKMMSVAIDVKGRKKILVKGNPIVVEKQCDPTTVPKNYHQVIQELSFRGYIVLALAYKNLNDAEAQKDLEELENNLTFYGIVLIQDKLKEGVEIMMSTLKQCEIIPLMISGDTKFNCLNNGLNSGILDIRNDMFMTFKDKDEIKFSFYTKTEINKKLFESQNDFSKLNVSFYHSQLLQNSYLKKEFNSNFQDVIKKLKNQDNISIIISGEYFIEIFEDPNISDVDKYNFMENCKIFYECNPYQKAKIVQAFKTKIKNSKIQNLDFVGYAGDSLNDTHAQQVADVSFGMRNREGKLYATFFFEDDITLIEKIIVNGKHSQEVTVCLFKWLMLSATFDLINTYMIIINMLTINDFSIMYLNFALILPISIFYGAIESRNKLNFHKPPNTLFHRKILFVYIAYFAMSVCFIYAMSQYFLQQYFYKYKYDVVDHHTTRLINGFFLERYFFLMTFFVVVCYAAIVQQSYPFQKNIWTNMKLIVYLCLVFAFNVFLMNDWDIQNYYVDYFQNKFLETPKNIPIIFSMKFLGIMMIFILILFSTEKINNYLWLIGKFEARSKGENYDIVIKSDDPNKSLLQSQLSNRFASKRQIQNPSIKNEKIDEAEEKLEDSNVTHSNENPELLSASKTNSLKNDQQQIYFTNQI